MPKSKEVDAWFARYEDPMKEVVLRMRDNLASFFPKPSSRLGASGG